MYTETRTQITGSFRLRLDVESSRLVQSERPTDQTCLAHIVASATSMHLEDFGLSSTAGKRGSLMPGHGRLLGPLRWLAFRL